LGANVHESNAEECERMGIGMNAAVSKAAPVVTSNVNMGAMNDECLG